MSTTYEEGSEIPVGPGHGHQREGKQTPIMTPCIVWLRIGPTNLTGPPNKTASTPCPGSKTRFSDDYLVTLTASLYWFTNSIGTSLRHEEPTLLADDITAFLQTV